MRNKPYIHLVPLLASVFLADSASAALMPAPFNSPAEDFRWPGGVIPYRIDPSIHEWRLTTTEDEDPRTLSAGDIIKEKAKTRAEVNAAIADWESKTGGVIDFVEIDPAELYKYERSVLITDHEDWGCASPSAGGYNIFRGAHPGEHPVYLPHSCSPATVKHELGHVIGFLHQHQSYIRDEYVTINESNMRYYGVEGMEEEHEDDMWNMRMLSGFFVAQVGPYDYKSIMHYGPEALWNEAGPTVVPINPPWAVIGYGENGGAISQGDVDAVKVMYARSRIKNRNLDRCIQTVALPADDRYDEYFYTRIIRDLDDQEVFASLCADEGFNEEWVLSPDGWLISANGRCAGTVEYGVRAPAGVATQLCDGSPEQKWSYEASTGRIKDSAGRCLWALDGASTSVQERTGDSNAMLLLTADCGWAGAQQSNMVWDLERAL